MHQSSRIDKGNESVGRPTPENGALAELCLPTSTADDRIAENQMRGKDLE